MDQIRFYGDFILKNFKKDKNSLYFSFSNYLFDSIFRKSNVQNNKKRKILENFIEKLYNKFDVFYYLLKQRKLEVIENALFSKEEKEMIKILSNKSYKIDFERNFEEEENEEKFEENQKIIDYINDSIKEKQEGKEAKKKEELIKTIFI